MQFAGAVRGQDNDGARCCLYRSDFGNRNLEIREKFEQERFEFIVGAIDFIDEKHALIAGANSLQEWTFDQKLWSKEIINRFITDNRIAHRADLQHLAGVIPLVERLVGIDTLVALQANELTSV